MKKKNITNLKKKKSTKKDDTWIEMDKNLDIIMEVESKEISEVKQNKEEKMEIMKEQDDQNKKILILNENEKIDEQVSYWFNSPSPQKNFNELLEKIYSDVPELNASMNELLRTKGPADIDRLFQNKITGEYLYNDKEKLFERCRFLIKDKILTKTELENIMTFLTLEVHIVRVIKQLKKLQSLVKYNRIHDIAEKDINNFDAERIKGNEKVSKDFIYEIMKNLEEIKMKNIFKGQKCGGLEENYDLSDLNKRLFMNNLAHRWKDQGVKVLDLRGKCREFTSLVLGDTYNVNKAEDIKWPKEINNILTVLKELDYLQEY